MNERDLAVDEAARHHVRRFAYFRQRLVDGIGLRMRPPVAGDGRSGDALDEIGNRTFRGLEHHAFA